MIIPVRCFTCNLCIGSKYKMYHEIISKIEKEKEKKEEDRNPEYDYTIEPSHNAFNILGLTRYCCRRHMLAHVDLIDII